MSPSYHVPATWLWSSYLISLSLSFHLQNHDNNILIIGLLWRLNRIMQIKVFSLNGCNNIPDFTFTSRTCLLEVESTSLPLNLNRPLWLFQSSLWFLRLVIKTNTASTWLSFGMIDLETQLWGSPDLRETPSEEALRLPVLSSGSF